MHQENVTHKLCLMGHLTNNVHTGTSVAKGKHLGVWPNWKMGHLNKN